MGAAAYRIGPSDFFTPGDLAADATTLNGQITALDNAIDGNNAIPQPEWDAFWVWMGGWKAFYSEHFGGFFSEFTTALNDSNRDQLVSFENQFLKWVETFKRYDINMPGPVIEPSTGAQDNLANHLKNGLGLDLSTVVIGVVVIVVAVVVFKVAT